MRFLPFLFLSLISCSGDILYNETSPHIFVEILNHSDTVLVGDTVLFQAVISPSPEDVEFFWIIENKASNNTSYSDGLLFKRRFMESGLYNVNLYAKDKFYDLYIDSLFIRVSNAPVCKRLSVKIFQGSPTFEWDCMDTDSDDPLTYRFSLFNEYGSRLTDTTLTKETVQLGYALPENYRTRLIFTNKYGIRDSIWGLL